MVKFDIVSGFLGAGKTTLIRQILKSLGKEKVVIIENEYGETQIDKEVLSVAGFKIYELTNGCVCCTLKEDFRLTLREILNQNVDRIIFEPSGIFVLSEIFELFKDLQISSRCTLNSVITVVDALNFFKHANSYSGFFANQIELASSLVVSKTQFVDKEEVKRINAELRRMNGTALIVDMDWEDISAYDLAHLLDRKPDRSLKKGPFQTDHDFESLGLQTSRTFEVKDLEQLLDTLKNGHYGEVIRGKGIVHASEGEGFLEFNYVDGHYEIEKLRESTIGAVSFIGTSLQTEELKRIFTRRLNFRWG